MHHILFVDDEPRILTGLRRMLRSQRHEWEMEFAEGGIAGLRSLQLRPFDVVVCDARMPGMAGSELLEEVRCDHPDTVRMILSGQCSRESAFQCVGVTHQFLSKPCDAESLIAAIRKVCLHRDDVIDQTARASISRVSSLPSQADVHATFAELMAMDSPPLQCVSETIGSDVAMSMKVIQLVSSGFFGTPQPIVDVHRAVELLGLETIRSLASLQEVFRSRQFDELNELSLRKINDHCLEVAAAAQKIAESVTNNPKLTGHAYLAGLLHEAVPLISSSNTPLGSVRAAASGGDAGQTSAFDDPLAGAYLAAIWGLPKEVVETIARFRNPGESGETSFTSVTAVHVAHACLDSQWNREVGEGSGELDFDYLQRIRCADRLSQWREICDARKPGEVLQ